MLGTALLAVIAAVGAVAVTRVRGGCGEGVESLPASRSSSPFLDASERRREPDHDRDALVRALGHGGPFGPVLGAVGYHYEQWAQLSSFDTGLGVRTRDNPDFTMLGADLRPRWSVHVPAHQSSWDADDHTYLVATLGAQQPVQLLGLDLRTGERRWCAEPGGRVRSSDAFATQFLDDGDVVVLRGRAGHERVLRLSGGEGATRWSRTVDAADGDFLGSVGGGLLLAGGTPDYDLLDPRALQRRRAGPALVAVSASDGRTRWRRESPAGTGLHVLGTDPGTGVAVVARWSAHRRSGTLIGLDRNGRVLWSRVPVRGARFDSALRSGRVLVRSGSRWSAYDARTGEVRWRRTMPSRPQFLPYGFELGDIPLLDGDHVLLGTTTALRVLDLRDGSMPTQAHLPTDGINTTYWPYQVVVTDRLVGVATNTGAVVLRRK